MKTHTVTTYDLNELSDEAIEKALNDNRFVNVEHYEWYDSAFEDFKSIGEILGIAIEDIYFRGFSSQGDGLCFTGRFEYSKEWRRRLTAYAPKTWECPKCGKVHENEHNKEYHVLGEQLQALQRKAFYGVWGTVKHRGHYNHSGCTEFDIRHNWDGDVYAVFDAEDFKQVYRELMDTFYKQLEREYDYLTSDESVRETLTSNYEFLEDGTIYN